MIGGERPRVHPQRGTGPGGFQGGDLAGRVIDQLAIVTDKQHGLGRLRECALKPAFGRDIQIVVGLVQQQDLVRTVQQGFEHQTFLLPARQRVDPAKSGQLERNSQGCGGMYVTFGLEFIPAHIGPVGQRLRIRELVAFAVTLHERQLGAVQTFGGHPDAIRCHRQQQIADGRVVTNGTDELPHHPELPAPGDGPVMRIGVAGDDAQQCRLSGPVGADQRGFAAFADPEADIVEKRSAVRELIADGIELHMAHG